jgi:hypothetical protein
MEETPQQSPARKRSWFARHKVLTALLVLIGLGVIGSATGGGNSSQTSQKSSPEPSGKVAGNATSEPVKSGAPSTPAAKAESYQQILTFSGNGSKSLNHSRPLGTGSKLSTTVRVTCVRHSCTRPQAMRPRGS